MAAHVRRAAPVRVAAKVRVAGRVGVAAQVRLVAQQVRGGVAGWEAWRRQVRVWRRLGWRRR